MIEDEARSQKHVRPRVGQGRSLRRGSRARRMAGSRIGFERGAPSGSRLWRFIAAPARQGPSPRLQHERGFLAHFGGHRAISEDFSTRSARVLSPG